MITETDRLILRELTTDDAPFIFHLVNEPAWLQFIGDKGVRNIDDAVNYIQNGPVKSYNTNGFGLWLVIDKQENIPIGMCGLIKRDSLEDVDMGFAYRAVYRSKGYGVEAATATLAYAKHTLGLTRIVAIANQDNVRSLKLLEKVGFQFERMITMPGDDKAIVLMGVAL
jgi:ribosomal-protein-alanine N-acetyltransferase